MKTPEERRAQTASEILVEHSPVFSELFLDDDGRKWKARVLAAMEVYKDQETTLLREELQRLSKEVVDLKEVYNHMDVELGVWYQSDRQNQEEIKRLSKEKEELKRLLKEAAMHVDSHFYAEFKSECEQALNPKE